MKKIVIGIIVILIAAAGGYAWWNRTQDDDTESSEQQTSVPTDQTDQLDNMPSQADQAADAVEVDIQDFAFQPSNLTIKAGTTVTWTNQDDVGHTVTPDEDNNTFEGSELLGKGQTYSVTFNTPGTFPYHCTPHPNMTATVTVTE